VLSLEEQEEQRLAMPLALLQARLLEVTETLEELEELWLELLEGELLALLLAMHWKTWCLEAKAKERERVERAVKASLGARARARARAKEERAERC